MKTFNEFLTELSADTLASYIGKADEKYGERKLKNPGKRSTDPIYRKPAVDKKHITLASKKLAQKDGARRKDYQHYRRYANALHTLRSKKDKEFHPDARRALKIYKTGSIFDHIDGPKPIHKINLNLKK